MCQKYLFEVLVDKCLFYDVILNITVILKEFLDDFKKPNEELTSDDVVKALLQFKEWIESDNDDTANTTEFKRAHKTLKKKIELSRDFPRQEVALAYLKPAVDLSTEEFQWGVPNLSALRTYCLSKFGWSSEKTDDKLLPVIRKYNTIDQREPRDNIFEGLPRPVPNKPRSAKLEQTLHQIAQKRSSFLNTVDQQLRELERIAKIREQNKRRPRERPRKRAKRPTTENVDDESTKEAVTTLRQKIQGRAFTKRTCMQTVSTESSGAKNGQCISNVCDKIPKTQGDVNKENATGINGQFSRKVAIAADFFQ
jgi:hypothetical protein